MQMRSAIVALALAAILLIGGGLFLLFQLQAGVLKSRVSYSTARLAIGSYSNTIECTGSIEPYSVSDVFVPAKATVNSVQVRNGDYVSAGQALFTVVEGSDSAAGEQQTAVTARSAGTVANVRIVSGSTASSLNGSAALQITDLNSLIGIVEVPEGSAPYIRMGNEVKVEGQTPSGDNVVLDGTLMDYVETPSLSTDGSAQTSYKLMIMFGDTKGVQVASKITTHIHVDDYGTVYYVPASAVAEQDGRYYVEVVYTNATVERHQVQLLGAREDGQLAITGDALAEGSTIRADLNE